MSPVRSAWWKPKALSPIIAAIIGLIGMIVIAFLAPAKPTIQIDGPTETIVIGPVTILAPIVGTDSAGHQAEFQFYIFSDEYNWQYETDSVEMNGIVQPEGLIRHLSAQGIQKRFDEAEYGIIAVGVASFGVDRGMEEVRADLRANRLVSWLHQTMNSRKPIYTVSLGMDTCKRAGPNETRDRRRIVLASILSQDPDADIDQAFRKVLESHGAANPPYQLPCYTKFELVQRS